MGLDRSYLGAVELGEFNVPLDQVVRIGAGLDTFVSALRRRAKI
jgi:hypothetical protein